MPSHTCTRQQPPSPSLSPRNGTARLLPRALQARAKEPQRRSLFEARVQLETRWQALSAEVAQAEAVAAAAVAATAAAATSAKAALAAENDKREAAEAAAAADAAALSGLEAAASAAAAEVAAAAAVEEAAITAAAAAEKRASASAAAAAQLTQLVTDTLAAVVELDTAQAETSGPLERLCTARETLLDAAKRVHRTRIGASATLTAAFAAESLAARISSAATRVRCALPDAIGALAAAVEEAEGAGSRYAAAAADVSSLSDALSDGVWQPALASVFHAASPGLRLCVSTASAAAAAGTALRSWAARARPWPAAAAAALREIEAPTLLPLAASSGSAATAVRAGTTVENAASVTGAIRSRRRNVTAASAASVTPTSTAVSITANVASLPRSVASSTGPLRGLLLQLTTLVSDVEVAMGRGRTADRVASGADGSPGEAAAAAVAKLAVDVDAHAALGVARRGALEAEAAAAAAHAEALRVVERQIRDSLARHEADVKEAASAAASARTVVTVAKAATKATSKDANGADVAKVGVVASAKAATASVTATNVLVTATPASQKKLQRDHAAKLTSLVSASATTAVAPQPPVDVIASSTSSAAQASVWRLVKLTPPEADDDDDNGNDGTAGSHKHETLNVPQPSAALPAKAPMDNVASTTSIASLSASARKLGGRGNVSFASAADGDGLSLDRVPPRPPQVMSAPAAKQARRSMSHASHSGGGSGGDISGSSGSSGRRLGSYGVVEQVSRKSLNGNNDDDWHFDAPPPRRARFSDGADTNLLGGSFGSYFRRGSSVGAGDGTLLATQRTPASTATSAAAPASAATLTAGSFRSDPAASPYDFSSDEAASGHGRASERAFGHHLPATATSARPGALTLTTVRPRVPRPAAGGAAASASRSHVSPKPAPRHGPGANDSPGSVVSMDLFSQCGLPTR